MELKSNTPPRKIIVGTVVQGFWGEYPGLDNRLGLLCGLIDQMGTEADKKYSSGTLDLVVFPELAVTAAKQGPGEDMQVPLEGKVLDTFGAKACEYSTYIIVTLDLVEDVEKGIHSNAAVLIDRKGKMKGIYRQTHPIIWVGENKSKGGYILGNEYPVFNCDFGKLGIQICQDVSFDEGWKELTRKGAEIVAWPTASPQTFKPAVRAALEGYYVISSTWRENASIYEPTGMVAAQVKPPQKVLVEQIDLSYALLPWSARLGSGKLLQERFEERIGFHYYESEDIGIFWSNDPQKTIKEMYSEFGLAERPAEMERMRGIYEKMRKQAGI